MSDAHRKTEKVFQEFCGEDRSKWLSPSVALRCATLITDALLEESDIATDVARELAHHVSDWQADAAFLTALHLCPERFSHEEIREGISALLTHIPYHVICAAKLGGYAPEAYLATDEEE